MKPGAAAASGLNPFPGLRPFREEEEYLFFGRERQVDSMVDKLAATRFLAVVGSSGSGKSSLVNCGLRPALYRGLMARAGSSWRTAQFRPGSEPVQALARALAADGVLYSGYAGEVPLTEVLETRLLASKRGLVDLWAKARPPAEAQLLIVVDQFEELFRYRRRDGSDGADASARAIAFVNLLLETREHPDCRIHIVITMRSDFIGECALFQGLPEAINAGQYLVPRLTREERRAAIAGPVGIGGAQIDPVLLTRLLNDLGDDPDQLSILQHALNRTWARWEEAGHREQPLAMAHYEASGTMAHALDLHAESAYGALSPSLQRVCELLFRALTDKGTDSRGIRRPTSLASLCAISGADEAEAVAAIEAFRAPGLSFLMPPAGEPLRPETVVDISHESLMRVWKRLQRWSDQEALAAGRLRRLAESAYLHRAGEADFLRGPELERALDWAPRERLERAWAEQYGADFEVVTQFLRGSTEARDAALERQRRRADAEREAAERELEQSKALADAQRQRADDQLAASLRQRRLSWLLGILLLLAAASAVFGWQQRGAAREVGRAALSKQLAALARVQLDLGEQRLALQFAAAGYRVTPTSEARRSLNQALRSQPQLRTSLTAHQSEVWGLSYSPDGRTLASASTDQTVILWDLASRKPRGEPLRGHRGEVWSVAFSPDGKLLASASGDRTAILWDAASHKPKGEPLRGHESDVWGVAFSPDGRLLASASSDKTVRLWDVATGQPLGPPLRGHTARVWSVAFSPDGRTLASGSSDGTLRLWDVAGRTPIGQALDAGRGEVSGVAFSPDGKMLAAGHADGTLTLWNVASRRQTGAPLQAHRDKVFGVAFSPDGKTLASTSSDKTVILWDVAARQPRGEPLRSHQDRVFNVAFAPDGQTLASASGDQSVILWDAVPAPARGEVLVGHRSAVWDVAFSPDGSLLATSSWDRTLILWDVATRQRLGEPLAGHTDRVWGIAFSPDGRMLASASSDKTVILWDVVRRQPIGQPLRGHTARVWGVAFSPDGKLLASASADGSVRLWDVGTGLPLGEPLRGHRDRVFSVAFSPDGKLLASASGDNTAILWDLATRQPRGAPLKGHESAVWRLAFSPDGRLLATSSGDRTLMLWDVASGKRVGKPLVGHRREPWGVDFSPDGRTLASASWDKTVILWDVATQTAIGDPLEGHSDRVWNVAYSPDGKTLASVSGDKMTILWDMSQVNPDILSSLSRACTIANRNLSQFEWAHAVGAAEPYQAACPELPVPSSAAPTHENTLK